MTAKQDGAAIGPPDPQHEKAALAGGSLNEAIDSVAKLTSPKEQVKLEARQHLERWLKTGKSYHLALARAKWYALRKGRV
jgi:hypothetical protein